MKLLRIAVIVYACLFVLGGVVLLQHVKSGFDLLFVGYLFINGAIVAAGILFERGRYKENNLPTEGWQPTGERFRDDASGKLMEVDFNAKTGQRRYREVG